VQPSELRQRPADQRLDLLAGGDVARDGNGADGLSHLLGGPDVHVRDDDTGALAREQVRRRGADPTSSARDQRDAIGKPHFVSVSKAAPPSFRGSEAPDRYPSRSATITCGREK